MKIVIAPDSFKGSLSARQACKAITAGVRRVVHDAVIEEIPMADGGEGTVDALVTANAGQLRTITVQGPLKGQTVPATYGILPDGTAVIEMASAAGLPLVPVENRNPLHTTTYGLGQLIADAARQGCRRFVIGLGGSATNDCGCGMAQALGIRFMDSQGRELTEPLTGGLLAQVEHIDITGLADTVKQSRFIVACDVDNPLLGPTGATRVYSAQKGADNAIQTILETNISHIIDIIEHAIGRKVREMAGAGAAGGLGAALIAFCRAELDRGIEIVLQQNNFSHRITGADLVITGEGRIDNQTVFGKTIAGVARSAQAQNIPTIAVVGSVGTGARAVLDIGVTAYMSICPGPLTLDEAIQRGDELLSDTAEQIIRTALIRL